MTIEAVKSQAAIGAQRRIFTTDEVGADSVANSLQTLISQQAAGTAAAVVAKKTGTWDCSTNVLVDVSPDVDISIGANETWQLHYALSFGDAIANSGVRLNVIVPSGATKLQSAILVTDNGLAFFKTSTGAAFSFAKASLTSAASAMVIFEVTVVNGSTAGTITLEFCQATLDATALTLKANSTVVATKL